MSDCRYKGRRRPPRRLRQFPAPSLEDLQHWTFVMGRAQQMMMEHLAAQMGEAAEKAPARRIRQQGRGGLAGR